jgi:hypothetical protein
MTQQGEHISAVYNSDTEVMFPLRVIPYLRSLRVDVWKTLIDEVTDDHANLINQAAFTLMMVKLGGCQGCSVDSYRGMRGCTQCARQTIRRFRGADLDLLRQYQTAQSEVQRHLNQA